MEKDVDGLEDKYKIENPDGSDTAIKTTGIFEPLNHVASLVSLAKQLQEKDSEYLQLYKNLVTPSSSPTEILNNSQVLIKYINTNSIEGKKAITVSCDL